MSQIDQCQSCMGKYDGLLKMPMILPCTHHLCYQCVNDQFQKNMNIKCFIVNCLKVHNVRPTQLQEDLQLLKDLESQGIQESITLLEKQYQRIQKSQVQLTKSQNAFISNLVKQVFSYMSKDNKDLQKQLCQQAKQIQNQLKNLKILKKMLRDQGSNQYGLQQGLSNTQLEQYVQKLEADTQQAIQQNMQTSAKFFEELEKIKYNLAQATQENSNRIIYQPTNQVQQPQQQSFQPQSQLLQQQQQPNYQSFIPQQNFQGQQNWQQQQPVQQAQNPQQIFQVQTQQPFNSQQNQQRQQIQQQYQPIQPPFIPQYNLQGQQKLQQQQQPQLFQNKQSSTQPPQPQPETQDLQITIVSPNNKSVVLSVKQDTTIAQIKDQINQETNLYMYFLDLLKNNNILEEGQTVVSQGIVDGESIQLRLNQERWDLVDRIGNYYQLYFEWGLL